MATLLKTQYLLSYTSQLPADGQAHTLSITLNKDGETVTANTALGKLPVRGTIVTARATDTHYDFVSRFFAPAVGVSEDPVTGSAHCCLTPYWAEKLGKTEMLAYQASARGGLVRVCLAGARVLLSGQAITVMKCEFIG